MVIFWLLRASSPIWKWQMRYESIKWKREKEEAVKKNAEMNTMCDLIIWSTQFTYKTTKKKNIAEAYWWMGNKKNTKQLKLWIEQMSECYGTKIHTHTLAHSLNHAQAEIKRMTHSDINAISGAVFCCCCFKNQLFISFFFSFQKMQ